MNFKLYLKLEGGGMKCGDSVAFMKYDWGGALKCIGIVEMQPTVGEDIERCKSNK